MFRRNSGGICSVKRNSGGIPFSRGQDGIPLFPEGATKHTNIECTKHFKETDEEFGIPSIDPSNDALEGEIASRIRRIEAVAVAAVGAACTHSDHILHLGVAAACTSWMLPYHRDSVALRSLAVAAWLGPQQQRSKTPDLCKAPY